MDKYFITTVVSQQNFHTDTKTFSSANLFLIVLQVLLYKFNEA